MRRPRRSASPRRRGGRWTPRGPALRFVARRVPVGCWDRRIAVAKAADARNWSTSSRPGGGMPRSTRRGRHPTPPSPAKPRRGMRIPVECERIFGRPVTAQFCVGGGCRPGTFSDESHPGLIERAQQQIPVRVGTDGSEECRRDLESREADRHVEWAAARSAPERAARHVDHVDERLADDECIHELLPLIAGLSCRIDLTAAVMGSTVRGS